MKFIIGSLIIATIVGVESVELPSIFKICHRSWPNHTECISEAVTDAVVAMAQGLKSFKILPLEPLEIDSVSIGDTGGVVSIKQSYKNVKFYGITKGLKVVHDPLGSEDIVLQSNTYNDQIDFVGDYIMEGRVLLLPIQGKGKSNITMIGLKSRHVMDAEYYEKNGSTYINVKKYAIKFSPKKVIFSFENLFNGNEVLSNQMNKFLNENWEIVFKETQEPFEETLGLVFKNIANNVFSRIPAEQLFPK